MEPQSESLSWTLVSVRSDVERMVDPDGVTLRGEVSATRDTKVEALAAAAVAMDSLKTGLGALGGVPLSASTMRNDLTWSTRQVTSTPEWEEDGRGGTTRTGRIVASARIWIGVRNFDLLTDIEVLLAAMDSYRSFGPDWSVDTDNPAWNEVRAEAIAEALRKGSAYATALGSALVSLEHVGDLGLLGREPLYGNSGLALSYHGERSTPSLDPVPQRLSAQIEARFRVRPVRFDR